MRSSSCERWEGLRSAGSLAVAAANISTMGVMFTITAFSMPPRRISASSSSGVPP